MEGPSLYETIPKILESLDYDILWVYNYANDSNVLTEALYTSGFFLSTQNGDKVIVMRFHLYLLPENYS